MNAFKLLLLALLVFAAPSLAHAQEGRLQEARERWERLDPADRERLRERFERYRQLGDEQRASLERRARFLRETQGRVEERLSAQERERLEQLPPDRRRQVLRDLVLHECRERGDRLHGALPKEWRERMEQVPPSERPRVLAEMQHKMRERSSRGAVEWLGRRLDLEPEEIQRLQGLPEDQRMQAVLDLHRRVERLEAERRSIPPERAEALRAVAEALRPRPQDFLGLEDLSREERRERVGGLVRARVMESLRAGSLLPPERLAELEQASPEEFRDMLRELLPHRGDRRRGPGRPDHDHPPGERGPGGRGKPDHDHPPGDRGREERGPGKAPAPGPR